MNNTHVKGYDTKPRLFAIGDIKGDMFALANLMLKIRMHPLALNDTFVFIGNLVGRGPASRGVINYVSNLKNVHPTNKIVVLRGPDDHRFLLSKPAFFFESPVGRVVLNSFKDYRGSPKPTINIRDLCVARKYIHSLPFVYETEHLVFVPSCLDISKPINQQDRGLVMFKSSSDLYTNSSTFPKRIVHGNCPQSLPTIRKNLINVDGSKDDKMLSCVVFDQNTGTPLDIITTERSTNKDV